MADWFSSQPFAGLGIRHDTWKIHRLEVDRRTSADRASQKAHPVKITDGKMQILFYIKEFIEFTWPLTLGLVFLCLAVVTAVQFGVFSDQVSDEE